MTIHHRDIHAAGVEIETLPAPRRFSLRLRAKGLPKAGKVLGLNLPAVIGMRSMAGGRSALCLGPDEWLLEWPEGELPALPKDLPHALVDISDREITWRIDGPRAAELLSIGIARNLAVITIGRGCRTAFGSVQVVLVREAEDRFTLSAWRSFAPHVSELLAIGRRELASGL